MTTENATLEQATTQSGSIIEETQPPAEHHCVYCPNCSSRLHGLRCKLVCAQCGYYLSCADYY